MSTASMPERISISRRMASVQGSAPKMPICSELSRGSTPWRTNSSLITCMYDGVTMMMLGAKSRISCTCFSVCPPDIGTTVHPARSAP
ncbi:hypothetical protein D3C71_1977790 [compost metagenome]